MRIVEMSSCRPAGGDRRTFLGGTDLACLLGLSSWGNAVSVWLDKTGQSYPDADSELLQIGRAIEPVISQLYEYRNADRGWKCVEVGPQRHNKHTWAGGSPDRLVCLPDGSVSHGLELKNVSIYAKRDRGELTQNEPELDNETEKNWGKQGTDQIPIPYLVQVQWYLTITGLPFWDVAPFFMGSRLGLYRVMPDETISDMLLEVGGKFWQDHVLSRTPPEIDGSKYSKFFLDRAYTQPAPGIQLKADAHAENLLADYCYHRACIAKHEQAKALLGNRLKQIIGNAEGINGTSAKATWKYPIDSKRENPQRTFRLIDTGGKDYGCKYD